MLGGGGLVLEQRDDVVELIGGHERPDLAAVVGVDRLDHAVVGRSEDHGVRRRGRAAIDHHCRLGVHRVTHVVPHLGRIALHVAAPDPFDDVAARRLARRARAQHGVGKESGIGHGEGVAVRRQIARGRIDVGVDPAVVRIVRQPAGGSTLVHLGIVVGRRPDAARAVGEEAVDHGRLVVGIDDHAVDDLVLLDVAQPAQVGVGLEHRDIQVAQGLGAVEGVDRHRGRDERGRGVGDVVDDGAQHRGETLRVVGAVELPAAALGGGLQQRAARHVGTEADPVRLDVLHVGDSAGKIGLEHVLGQIVQAVPVARAVAGAGQRLDLAVRRVVGGRLTVGEIHDVSGLAGELQRRLVDVAVVRTARRRNAGERVAGRGVRVPAIGPVLAAQVQIRLVESLGQRRAARSVVALHRVDEVIAHRARVDVRHREGDHAALGRRGVAAAIVGVVAIAHETDVHAADLGEQVRHHVLHDRQARAGDHVGRVVVPVEVVGAVEHVVAIGVVRIPGDLLQDRTPAVGVVARVQAQQVDTVAMHAGVRSALDRQALDRGADLFPTHVGATELRGAHRGGLALDGELVERGLALHRGEIEPVVVGRRARRRQQRAALVALPVDSRGAAAARVHDQRIVRSILRDDLALHAARGVEDEQHVRLDARAALRDEDLGVVRRGRTGAREREPGADQQTQNAMFHRIHDCKPRCSAGSVDRYVHFGLTLAAGTTTRVMVRLARS